MFFREAVFNCFCRGCFHGIFLGPNSQSILLQGAALAAPFESSKYLCRPLDFYFKPKSFALYLFSVASAKKIDKVGKKNHVVFVSFFEKPFLRRFR